MTKPSKLNSQFTIFSYLGYAKSNGINNSQKMSKTVVYVVSVNCF